LNVELSELLELDKPVTTMFRSIVSLLGSDSLESFVLANEDDSNFGRRSRLRRRMAKPNPRTDRPANAPKLAGGKRNMNFFYPVRFKLKTIKLVL
jgi:hypothetical protein